MNNHINRLVRSSYYQLRRIKSIRQGLHTSTAIQLVKSFIISRVDYCNSILAGVPKYQLELLQSILNVAVRLIFGYSQYDHITTLLRDRLHWLQVTQRIDFKRSLTIFKALNGLAPGYISDYCVRVSTNQRRSRLRSVSQDCLVVPPPSKTIKFRERSFGICGPTTWNSLPDCKRRRLHWRVQVKTKNLLIWIIVWLDWILQLCCKCALVLRTVHAYGLRRNINYHNNNNIIVRLWYLDATAQLVWSDEVC